jgi:plasmid stability protein
LHVCQSEQRQSEHAQLRVRHSAHSSCIQRSRRETLRQCLVGSANLPSGERALTLDFAVVPGLSVLQQQLINR